MTLARGKAIRRPVARVIGLARELGRATWIAIGVLVAAVVLVAALGGFAPRQVVEDPIDHLAPGDRHDSAMLSTTVVGATISHAEDHPAFYLDDGEEAVLVDLVLENRWDRPLSVSDVIADVLAFDPAIDDDPRFARTDSGLSINDLQPGVPVAVSLIWETEEGSVSPGDELRVTISDGELQQFQVLDDDIYWDDFAPAAEVVLTVEKEQT